MKGGWEIEMFTAHDVLQNMVLKVPKKWQAELVSVGPLPGCATFLIVRPDGHENRYVITVVEAES